MILVRTTLPSHPLLARRAPVDALELPFEALPELVFRNPESDRVTYEHPDPLVEGLYLLFANRLPGIRHDRGPDGGPALDQTRPLQLVVRLYDRVRRNRQLLREPAHGRQPLTGPPRTDRQRGS